MNSYISQLRQRPTESDQGSIEIFIYRIGEGKKPAYRNCGCNEMYRNKKHGENDDTETEMKEKRELPACECERETTDICRNADETETWNKNTVVPLVLKNTNGLKEYERQAMGWFGEKGNKGRVEISGKTDNRT